MRGREHMRGAAETATFGLHTPFKRQSSPCELEGPGGWPSCVLDGPAKLPLCEPEEPEDPRPPIPFTGAHVPIGGFEVVPALVTSGPGLGIRISISSTATQPLLRFTT